MFNFRAKLEGLKKAKMSYYHLEAEKFFIEVVKRLEDNNQRPNNVEVGYYCIGNEGYISASALNHGILFANCYTRKTTKGIFKEIKTLVDGSNLKISNIRKDAFLFKF